MASYTEPLNLFLSPSKCFFFSFFFFRHILPAFCQDFHHFPFVLGKPSNFSRSVCSGLPVSCESASQPFLELRSEDPGHILGSRKAPTMWLRYVHGLVFLYEATTSSHRNTLIGKGFSSIHSLHFHLGLGDILNT